MRKIFFEENFRRMLCKIFPPSSCVGKGGTKRTTLEMVAKKFFRWLQILPSWGDSNLSLQDETNESRFEQLARLLPSWLDRHCPRKLLPPGAKEPHRKWLELCCLGKSSGTRETLRVTGEIPHIIFKELSWPHKRESIRILEMKRAFDTRKYHRHITHYPLSPNPSRSKRGQNMGQGEWKNRPYSSSSPANSSVNRKSDLSWKKTKPLNWISKQSFYISGPDFLLFLFYFFK